MILTYLTKEKDWTTKTTTEIFNMSAEDGEKFSDELNNKRKKVFDLIVDGTFNDKKQIIQYMNENFVIEELLSIAAEEIVSVVTKRNPVVELLKNLANKE